MPSIITDSVIINRYDPLPFLRIYEYYEAILKRWGSIALSNRSYRGNKSKNKWIEQNDLIERTIQPRF